MTNTSINTKLAGRLSVWKIAAAVTLVAAAMGSAGAQSTLKFVGPLEETTSPATQANEQPSATAASATSGSDIIVLAAPKRPATTEFRFLDASMDVAAAKTQPAESNAKTSTEPVSTLTLSKVGDQRISAAAKQAGDSLEFRFVDAAAAAASKTQAAEAMKNTQPVAPVRPQALDLAKTAFSDGLIAVPGAAAVDVKAAPTSLVANKANAAPAPAVDFSASLTKVGQEAKAAAPASQIADAKSAARLVVSPFAATQSTNDASTLVAEQLKAATEESSTIVLSSPAKAAPVVTPPVVAVAPPQVRDLTGDLTQANSAALVASRQQLPSALKSQFAMVTKEQPKASASVSDAESAKIASDFSAKLVATPNDIYSRQSTLNTPSFSYLAVADDAKAVEAPGAANTAAPPIPTPPSQPAAVLAGGDSKPEPKRDSMGGMRPLPVGPESGSCARGCPYGPCQSGAQSICGVDCGSCGAPCSATWRDTHCIPWSMFGPGEYVGPARTEHVSTYYLRVNDLLTLTYITSRRKNAESYRIGVGDKLQVEWLRIASNTDVPLNRELLVQPDGTVSLPLIGEVVAAGKTVTDFQDEITKLFGKYQREPQITVTPLEVNVGLRDVINAVTSVSGSNGQSQALRVTPEGTIQAPGLGSVYAQGLTLDELRSELEARYASTFGPGLLVSPSLTERATSYVFMGGEVRTPGRYTLEGPTTVMQAVTLAGGWNNGGNLHQVVVFRRDENWCLKATKIDVRAPFYGHDPCPVNDVWLRDNDLVVVPKERILCAADVIELYFTRGVYAVFPISFVKDFSSGSTITPIP